MLSSWLLNRLIDWVPFLPVRLCLGFSLSRSVQGVRVPLMAPTNSDSSPRSDLRKQFRSQSFTKVNAAHPGCKSEMP